jgi:hypothetical protein
MRVRQEWAIATLLTCVEGAKMKLLSRHPILAGIAIRSICQSGMPILRLNYATALSQEGPLSWPTVLGMPNLSSLQGRSCHSGERLAGRKIIAIRQALLKLTSASRFERSRGITAQMLQPEFSAIAVMRQSAWASVLTLRAPVPAWH